jgi:SAM-dependent methyltransferase
MTTTLQIKPPGPATISRGERLRRFLCAYWLRPENAFWMALRSDALAAERFDSPSIDLACGDGVFSFLHAGGVFEDGFDVFQAVGRLDEVRPADADMFDHVDPAYGPRVSSPPQWHIDVGCDLKPALLEKASFLDFYGRLFRHDCNKPLPFDDHSLATTYCNAAYWIKRIDPFLRELRRITAPGGRIVLHVKLDSIRACTLEKHRSVLGDRFLDIIGRGRFDCWPTLADRATWERRFGAAGLQVESATPLVTPTHARIWDIGLRPIAPLLVKMTAALSSENRLAIKREWVDLFHELLTPICDPAFDLGATSAEPVEIQYVLAAER